MYLTIRGERSFSSVGRLALRLAFLPVRAVGDLLDSGQHHRVEILPHFDEDELSLPVVLAIQIDDRVAGGPGTGEVVEDG